MKLTFLGAAGEVTGSQHLLETDSLRLLLDCGLFQGHRAEARSKNEHFRCSPRKLDAVILSHAHIDHSGNLPGLYRQGFRGPIYCTPATADITAVMLRDSAGIQAEDARYLNKHRPRGEPLIHPLYSEEDVSRVCRQFEPLDYDRWHELSPALRVRFRDAGHILGSAVCELEMDDAGRVRRVVFTGDLGRRHLPLLKDPALIEGPCDVLISESTYGNRVHLPAAALKAELLRIVQHAVGVQGRVIIPAFSLGRTQQVVYFLNELHNEGALPELPVYVDSPLSMRLTSIYREHQGVMDAAVQTTLRTDADPFDFPGLYYIRATDESKALNRREGAFVVISASGMCETGRVVHHLKHAVGDDRNTIVIIGFQAQHTLGRRLVERQPRVKIHDRMYPLKARVETLNGLSAHADAEDFKWWYEHLAETGGAGQVFLVHGEEDAARGLAALVRDLCDEDPVIPQLYESFEV